MDRVEEGSRLEDQQKQDTEDRKDQGGVYKELAVPRLEPGAKYDFGTLLAFTPDSTLSHW